MTKRPITIWHVSGYRRFTSYWWIDVIDWLIGVEWDRYAREMRYPWYRYVDLSCPGWIRDLYTIWHRARYGWAPRDTWNLTEYVEGVLADTLEHLADHTCGVPGGYPDREDLDDPDQARWEADLRTAAVAFREHAEGVEIYDREENYVRHDAEEERRHTNREAALAWLTAWIDSLWD